MENVLPKIIQVAISAPSGHNYQPWKFHITADNTVRIFNLPERDTTIFNFRQRGSYIAHGALIENIAIVSSAEGYKATVRLFPDEHMPDLTAEISLEQSVPRDEPLARYIPMRTTNRKPYSKKSLLPEHKEEILKNALEITGAEIRIMQDPQKINALASSFSLNERLVLENRFVHQSLFPHILWTEKENLEKRAGLYIKTLELSPPARILFKLLKHWPLAHLTSKIGLPRSVAAQNKKLYAASTAIGVVVIPSNSAENFIIAGRIMQRVWLTTAKLKLCLQPVAAVVYLWQRVREGESEKFTPAQVTLIEEAYKEIADIFSIRSEIIAMPFRIGYNGAPSARALRLPAEIYCEKVIKKNSR